MLILPFKTILLMSQGKKKGDDFQFVEELASLVPMVHTIFRRVLYIRLLFCSPAYCFIQWLVSQFTYY